MVETVALPVTLKVPIPSLSETAEASLSELLKTERLSAKYPSAGEALIATVSPTFTVMVLVSSSLPTNDRLPFSVSARVTVAVLVEVSA